MTYADTDTTIAHITAQVVRLSATNGALSTVSGVLSNAGFSTTGRKVGLNFAHTFDSKNNYYYVRVDLTRSGTTGYSKLFGVSLDCSGCPAD